MNQPINIAYLDYSHIYAGAETVLHAIIENLDRNMFEPILVFPYPMQHQERYMDLICNKFWLADSKKWWMGSDRWTHPFHGTDLMARTIWGIRLAWKMKRNHISILHVNLLRPDCMMWLLPAKLLGIKVVGHFRSQKYEWIPPKRVQHLCDLVLCVSDYNRKRLLLKGEHAKSLVVYDSIDIKASKSHLSKQESKKRLGFPEDCYLISSVGQLSQHKGHDNAIIAFQSIAKKNPKALLCIVGGGEDLKRLMKLANNSEFKNRIIFTKTQVPNVMDYYRASNLVLSLTRPAEAFGLVPFEASLMGTPFIAPDEGAVKEFINHGESGLLVNTNNIDEIIMTLSWAISHPYESDIMCYRAQNIIKQKLTTEIMTKHLEIVYKQVYHSRK